MRHSNWYIFVLEIVRAPVVGFFRAALIYMVSGSPVAADFTVFDGTLFEQKSDLAPLEPLTILYVSRLWPNWHEGIDRGALPPKQHIQKLARDANKIGRPVVLDIEHWSVTGEDEHVRQSIEKYMTVLSWFKSAAPDVTLGLYGVLPIRDYWRAFKGPRSDEYEVWAMENDRLMLLADYVDVIYPSIYTFYPSRKEWVLYAKAQIAEARKYGKPVVAFLMPYYHESNLFLGGKPLPADYWRVELDTICQIADGAVIWGGWWDPATDKRAVWDEEALWWRTVKLFFKDLKNPETKC